MEIGYLTHNQTILSKLADEYIDMLKLKSHEQ